MTSSAEDTIVGLSVYFKHSPLTISTRIVQYSKFYRPEKKRHDVFMTVNEESNEFMDDLCSSPAWFCMGLTFV